MTMTKAYFAYTAILSDNWKELVTPPKAPSNYKDILKIEEYESKAWSTLGQTAKNDVMTGQLGLVKYQTSMSPGSINVLKGSALQLVPGFVRCFCLKPSIFLRLAVAEDIVVHGALPQTLQWALKSESTGRPILGGELGGLTSDSLFVDPVRAILGSSSYDEDDLPRIAKRFGVTDPTKDLEAQLQFVRGLAKLLGEA